MRLLPILMILVIPAPGIAQRTCVVDVQDRPGTQRGPWGSQAGPPVRASPPDPAPEPR